VRTKVRALKAAQKSAPPGRSALAPYLETARDFVARRTPLLVITHGLSGSGKTHVTQALIGGLRALRVRSDLERKRMHGLDATARSGSAVGSGLYDSGSTARTYARLADVATAAMRNGFDAIVDATFLRRTEREALSRIAKQHNARFVILDCVAPEEVLRRRIAARATESRDASEASLAVLDHQLSEQDPLGADEQRATIRVPTDAPLDVSKLLAAFARRSGRRK
jgi:predicted kinase